MTTKPKATHCRRGHKYTEASTYITPSTGRRSCRLCIQAYRESLKYPKVPKTHCNHGHQMTPDNWYVNRTNPTYHTCLACRRERARAHWLEKQQ